MAASTLAFFGANEVMLAAHFGFSAALSIGLVLGLMSSLVLAVSGTENVLRASLISGGTLASVLFVFGILASFSANAVAPFGLMTPVEVFAIVGIFGGLGYHFGGKLG
jgi:hypothetical protein